MAEREIRVPRGRKELMAGKARILRKRRSANGWGLGGLPRGGRWRRAGGGLRGIFHAKECGDYVAHVAEFGLGKELGIYAGLGQENELAEVAEGGGAAVGDAVGREGLEDALEGAMHIEVGIGAGKAGGQFGGKIGFLGGAEAAMELGVGAAKVAVGGGHAALASVGKFKVAELVGIVLASHSGERIANSIL
jgi:hypothetical protein